jgi:hypothetical protein
VVIHYLGTAGLCKGQTPFMAQKQNDPMIGDGGQPFSCPRPAWWPLLAWVGELHVSADGGKMDFLGKEIEELAQAGMHAVALPALHEGVPLYDSPSCCSRARLRHPPWSGRFKRRIPPFSQMVRLAASAGLRPWARIELLTGGQTDVKTLCLAQARPRWTVRNALGRPSPIASDTERLFLCPSHPEVVRLYSEIAIELALGYPIAALVLDLRQLPPERFDGPTAHCVCFQCQEQVEADLELDLQEVLEEGTPEIWLEWRRWREAMLTKLIRRIRTQVWTVRPGLPIFALVEMTPEPANELYPSTESLSVYRPWEEWARSGLVDMILLEQATGQSAETERHLMEWITASDLECPLLPCFHDSPLLARPGHWSRAIYQAVPGWAWTQRRQEAMETARSLNSIGGQGASCRYPAPECAPIPAAIEALTISAQLLNDAPLAGDIANLRDTLVSCGGDLPIDTLENLILQLATLVTILSSQVQKDDERLLMARGWLEMARRLLRWHANLHCQELYLFDAG